MKKLIHVGLLAVAVVSVACGGPVETDAQGQALPECSQEPQVATPDSSELPQEERVVSPFLSCQETNVCEQCSQGGRNKRTYYARQQWVGNILVCSDLRTEYGSCGSCAF